MVFRFSDDRARLTTFAIPKYKSSCRMDDLSSKKLPTSTQNLETGRLAISPTSNGFEPQT
jgi:hypothetical protein